MQNTKVNIAYDFQKELLELLDSNESDEDNKCLISNVNLDIKYVKLSCGHKFNYNSIFNEIKYQKKHTHYLETQKLSQNELKCPYCRTIQKGLLPSRENFNNIVGVNWPKKHQYKAFDCVYSFLSGKKKGNKCGKKCFELYCTGHDKIIKIREAKAIEKEAIEKEAVEKINVLTGTQCQYVFKKGKNKGTSCGRNSNFLDECYCSKHRKYPEKKDKLTIFQNAPTNVII
jgi:hypothetical protein